MSGACAPKLYSSRRPLVPLPTAVFAFALNVIERSEQLRHMLIKMWRFLGLETEPKLRLCIQELIS
jgi:hypothetical protein